MPLDLSVGLPTTFNAMEFADVHAAEGHGVFFADVDGDVESGVSPLQFTMTGDEIAATTTIDTYGHLSVEDARRTLEAAGWFTGREVRL